VTLFTFSVEQLRAAPPEVRRWVAGEIGRALGAVAMPPPEGAPHAAMRLVGCTVPEAVRVFELVGGDPVVARLFFELARESGLASGMPGVQALPIAELQHHLGLAEEALIDRLTAIDDAFRQAHGAPGAGLFGFDDAGHLYIHEATQASIRRLWQELAQARAAAEREPLLRPARQPGGGFVPPHLGPSENVAVHAAQPRPADDGPR
jgi:hypothetical protein